MNKQLALKIVSIMGVLSLFLFIPQNVVWGGLDFQTVPTLPPTATSTSTSTLTPTATITVTSTITSTNTSIPPTLTFTTTSTQPAQVSPTITKTPYVVVTPPRSNWIIYAVLALLIAIALGTGIIGYLLFIRKKKPSA